MALRQSAVFALSSLLACAPAVYQSTSSERPDTPTDQGIVTDARQEATNTLCNNQGKIMGQVVDAAGSPINKAEVYFPEGDHKGLFTDHNGIFETTKIEAGAIPIQIFVDGKRVGEYVGNVEACITKGFTAQIKSTEKKPSKTSEEGSAIQTKEKESMGVIQIAAENEKGYVVQYSISVTNKQTKEIVFSGESTPGGLSALQLFSDIEYAIKIEAPGYQAQTFDLNLDPNEELQFLKVFKKK